MLILTQGRSLWKQQLRPRERQGNKHRGKAKRKAKDQAKAKAKERQLKQGKIKKTCQGKQGNIETRQEKRPRQNKMEVKSKIRKTKVWWQEAKQKARKIAKQLRGPCRSKGEMLGLDQVRVCRSARTEQGTHPGKAFMQMFFSQISFSKEFQICKSLICLLVMFVTLSRSFFNVISNHLDDVIVK